MSFSSCLVLRISCVVIGLQSRQGLPRRLVAGLACSARKHDEGTWLLYIQPKRQLLEHVDLQQVMSCRSFRIGVNSANC